MLIGLWIKLLALPWFVNDGFRDPIYIHEAPDCGKGFLFGIYSIAPVVEFVILDTLLIEEIALIGF